MKKTNLIILSVLLLGGLAISHLRAKPYASHSPVPTAFSRVEVLPRLRPKQESRHLRRVMHEIETRNLDALTRCFVDWNESNSSELHSWLNCFRSSPESSQLIAAALARGGLHNSALEFALRLSESQRAVALKTAFEIHAATVPTDAWKLTDSISGKEDLRDLILEAGSDAFLPQLADLALHHQQSSGRTVGLHGTLSRWSLQDPAEAAAWMNQHTIPAEIRDSIACRLVFQCDSENRSAETAIAWAESITETQLRFDAINTAVQELADSDPAKAADAIHLSAVLTADEKQRLLNTLTTLVTTANYPAGD